MIGELSIYTVYNHETSCSSLDTLVRCIFVRTCGKMRINKHVNMEGTQHLLAICACATFFWPYTCWMCDILFLQLNAITGARISIRTCNLVYASADCLSHVHVPALRRNTKKSACGLLQNIKSACINPICNITAHYSLTNLHFNQFRCVLIKSLLEDMVGTILPAETLEHRSWCCLFEGLAADYHVTSIVGSF